MQEAKMETKSLTRPCPLYEEGFAGHCQDCFERQDCMIQTILGKVQRIETKLDSLK